MTRHNVKPGMHESMTDLGRGLVWPVLITIVAALIFGLGVLAFLAAIEWTATHLNPNTAIGSLCAVLAAVSAWFTVRDFRAYKAVSTWLLPTAFFCGTALLSFTVWGG